MKVIEKINIDLSRPLRNVIYAKQGDKNTREVQISLYSNGVQWIVPSESNFVVSYVRPDNSKGAYSFLLDGLTPAVSSSNNILNVSILQPVLAVSGAVSASVIIKNGQNEMIGTFSFIIDVEKYDCNVDEEGIDTYVKFIVESPEITNGTIYFGNFIDSVEFSDVFSGAILTVTLPSGGKEMFSMLITSGSKVIQSYYTSSQVIYTSEEADIEIVDGRAKWTFDPEQMFDPNSVSISLQYWRD